MLIDWVRSGWTGKYLALGHGARSVRHDLGPNIFPSGPPTQSISTYFCYLFCEFSFLIPIFGVCPGVRTCDIYFLFHLLVLGFSPCLMVSWLFCFLCFTSSVSLTGSYTKGQPKLEAPKMFCLVQFAEVLGSLRSTTRRQRQRHRFYIFNEQKALHALHMLLLFLCISFPFSTNMRREKTIFQVLMRTWTYTRKLEFSFLALSLHL